MELKHHSDMTTNGYLLNSRTSRLVTECQVQSYQITVDGTKEGHDNQRVLKMDMVCMTV